MNMPTVSSFDSYLADTKRHINRQLERIIEEEPHNKELRKLVDSITYTVLADGKRIRPTLSILVYELFDSNLEPILAPACAIELIHAASLMLDDLPCMDNATMRRGKQANHLVYGEATTILASAALWVAAFKIFSAIESVRINPLIAQTAQSIGQTGLIRGQFLDITSFKKARTIKELNATYYLKTAILFEHAVIIGAILGKATKRQERILSQFGRECGLAFQIRDDILDATAPTALTGKDERLDERNQKPTYVSLLGEKKAIQALEQQGQLMRQTLSQLDLPTGRLLDFISYLTHT